MQSLVDQVEKLNMQKACDAIVASAVPLEAAMEVFERMEGSRSLIGWSQDGKTVEDRRPFPVDRLGQGPQHSGLAYEQL